MRHLSVAEQQAKKVEKEMTIVIDNSQGDDSQDSQYGQIVTLLSNYQELFNNYQKPKDCLLRLLF